jgi:hypothetical protein
LITEVPYLQGSPPEVDEKELSPLLPSLSSIRKGPRSLDSLPGWLGHENLDLLKASSEEGGAGEVPPKLEWIEPELPQSNYQLEPELQQARPRHVRPLFRATFKKWVIRLFCWFFCFLLTTPNSVSCCIHHKGPGLWKFMLAASEFIQWVIQQASHFFGVLLTTPGSLLVGTTFLWLTLVWIVLTAVELAIWCVTWREQSLLAEGEAVPAQVVDKSEIHVSENCEYVVTVYFPTTGKPALKNIRVSKSVYRQCTIGDFKTVLYLRHDPDSCVVYESLNDFSIVSH